MKSKSVRSSSVHSSRSVKDQQQRSSKQKVSIANLHSVLDKIQFLQGQLETFLKSYPQENQLKYSFEKCRQLETQLKQQVKLKSELAEMYKSMQLQNQSLFLQLNLLQSDNDQDSHRSVSNGKLANQVEELKKQVKLYQERCQHLDKERKDSESPAQIRKQLNKAKTQNLTLRVKISHYERMIIHPPENSRAVSQSITLVAMGFQLQRIHSILQQCKKAITFQSELENKVLARAEVEKTRSQFQLLNYLESNAILRKQLEKSQQKITTLEKQRQQQSAKRYQSQQFKVKLNSSQYSLGSDMQLQKNLKQIQHKIREALSRQGNHVKTFNQVNQGSQKLKIEHHNHIILLELYIAEMDHAIMQLMRKNQHLAKNKSKFESTLQKYQSLLSKYKTQVVAYEKLVDPVNQKPMKESQRKRTPSQIVKQQNQTKLPIFLQLFETIQQQAQLEIICAKQQMQTIKFHYQSTISEMALQLQEMENLKKMLRIYKQRESKQIGNLERYKNEGKINGSVVSSPGMDRTVKHQTKNEDLDPYDLIKPSGKGPRSGHERQTAKKLKEKSIKNLSGSHANNSHQKLLTIESRQLKSANQDSDANEYMEITHKILSLEAQIYIASQQLKKLEQSKKATEKALLQSESQNQVLQRIIDQQYSPQLQKYELLKQQHQQLIHQINKLKAETNQNSELEKQRQLFINRINELQTKEKRLEQEFEKMHQEISRTKEEKEYNLRAISTELKEKEGLIKDLENTGVKNSVVISQVETKCSQYEGNLKQKEEELERLQGQVSRLKEQNRIFLNRQSKAVQQSSKQETQIQDKQLKQQIIQLKGQIVQLKDQLQVYVCQVSQKNQIIAELSDKVNAMGQVSYPDPHYTSLSRISSFTSENEMLPKDSKVQIESLRETVRNMESQLKKKEQKIAKQTVQLNQYSKLARKIDRYEKTLNQRAQQFTKLKEQYQSQCNQNLALKKKYELMSHSQKQDPNGLNSLVETERMEYSAKLDSLKLEIDKQLQQKRKLQENLQNLQKQVIKSLRKNSDLQQENHKLNSRLLHLQGAQQTQRQQHDKLFREMQESISIILFERIKQKEQEAAETKTRIDMVQSQKLPDSENRVIRKLQGQINQLKIVIGKREIEIGNLHDAIIKITRKLSKQKELDPQIKEIIRKVKEGHFDGLSSNKNMSSSSRKFSKIAPIQQQYAKVMNRAKSQGLESQLSEFNTIIVGTPSKDSNTSQVLKSEIEKFDFQNRQSQQLGTQRVQTKEQLRNVAFLIKIRRSHEKLLTAQQQNSQGLFTFRKYQQDNQDFPPRDQLQTSASKKAFGLSIRKVAQVGKVKGEKVTLLSQRSSSGKIQSEKFE